MLTFYAIGKSGLQPLPISTITASLDGVVWVDMLQPTPEEEVLVEQLVKADIPTRDEMHEIELSSRLYQENGILYVTGSIVTRADTAEPETHAVTFVLAPQCLITVRYVDPQPFRSYLVRSGMLDPGVSQGSTVLTGLLEAIVDRAADILEKVGRNIDAMTRQAFPAAPEPKSGRVNYYNTLRDIGLSGDLVSRTRESLISMTRLLGFVSQSSYFKVLADEQERVQVMLRDIAALSDHASFLSSKVTFVLEATLGMVQTEQNDIIKIFSVAAAMFLPPTLIASIYGMNFRFMPELQWHYGYPFALGLMVLSAYLPYRYFRRKGWL